MNIFDPLISGSLSVSGSGEISGDLRVLGTISGSIKGDGSQLFNIPSTGVTGLNLTRIADGSATASISSANGLVINTNTEITGTLKLNKVNLGSNDIVEITLTDAGQKYFIDGVKNPRLSFIRGFKYRFYYNNINVHPLLFSITNDGEHNGGIAYTTGVSTGNNPFYVQIEITDATPATLYYFCDFHVGMGNSISIYSDFLHGQSTINLSTVDSGMFATTGSNNFTNIQRTSGSLVVTGSVDVTGSINLFGAANISGSISLNGQAIGTGKLDETTFNSYTSSNDGRLYAIENSTSSYNEFTSSIETRIKNEMNEEYVISGSIQVILTGTTGYSTFSSSISTSIGSLSSSVATTTNGLSSSIDFISSSVVTTTGGLSSSIGFLSSSVATTTLELSSSMNSLSSSVATTTSGLSSSLSSSIESLSSSVSTTTSGLSSSVGSLSSSVATTTLELSSSLSSSIGSLSSSLSGDIGSLSSSVATTTNNLSTSIATTDLNQNDRLTLIETSTGSLNSYTSSNNTIIGTLQVSTGSLNTYTSSTNTKLGIIETSTSSLNTFTSSASTRLNSLEVESGSIRTDFNTYTGSNNTINTTQNDRLVLLETSSGSLNTYTSSNNSRLSTIESTTSSLNSYTSSNNTVNTTQNDRLVLLETASGSLNTFTSSANGRLTSLEGTTGSLNSYTSSNTTNINAIQISTSSLNTFTSSFNAAIELTGSNLTIIGDLLVKGTTTNVNVTSLDVDNNLINLNGSGASFAGLRIKDATEPNLISGSFLWDSLNDFWIGGQLGFEERFIRQTEFNTQASKISGIETTTGSLNSFTSSINTTIKSKLNSDGVFSSSIQVNHNATTNYVANQHVDHSTVSISTGAGSGLTGGGDITTTRNLSIATGGVTNAMLAGSIANDKLVNSSLTVGSTAISLGSLSTTLAGLTSVTSTAFTGSLQGSISGNAATVTTNANLTGVVTSTGNATTIANGNITNAMLGGSIANDKLVNSSFHVGTTSISLGRGSAAQTLNGVSIDGNSATTNTWATARTITIGNTGKSVNGSVDVAWSLAEIGAYAATNPSSFTSNLGTVTSVAGTGTVSGISLSGTVTSSGNLTLGGTLTVAASNFSSQTANTFLAAPNGSAGTPTFRTIAAADVPTLNQNTSGNAATATEVARTVGAGTEANLLSATIADNDYFRLRVGGGSNAGFVEIATADDGTEPIHVRQYTGVFSSLTRTATLLDGSGNTSFPGTVTAPTFSGALSGNATTATTAGALTSMNISQFTNNSGYITGISFANVSSKPTTISGYGITDAITTGNIGSQSVNFATSATTADQIDGVGFRNTGANSPVAANTLDSNGITYVTDVDGSSTNLTGNSTDGALYSQIYSSAWQHQIYGDYRTGIMYVRGKNNNTWQSWKRVALSSATTFSNVSSVTFNHTLGTANLTAQVFDTNGDMFFPTNIRITSTQVILTFSTNRSGRLVVTG